jgi:cobalt-zinc-cadmium efflux system outer membrane protein
VQVALARELENVSKEVLGSVKKRVAAGAASSVEQNRAQVELEMNRIQAQKAQFAFLASKRRLSALWGSSEPDFNALKGALESLPQLPAEEVLIQSTEQNPEIARLIADRDLLQAKLELEQSNGVPDLTIGGGVRYSNETEDSSFLVEFGLPLQFFDRRQDAADAALSRVNGSRESLRSIQVEIRNKIISSYQGYLSAKKEAETLRDRGLVQAQAAFAFARKGYLRGSLSLTDVLDTRRLLFEIKSRYLDTLSRCQMLAADIEELSGGSVELTYQ